MLNTLAARRAYLPKFNNTSRCPRAFASKIIKPWAGTCLAYSGPQFIAIRVEYLIADESCRKQLLDLSFRRDVVGDQGLLAAKYFITSVAVPSWTVSHPGEQPSIEKLAHTVLDPTQGAMRERFACSHVP